MLTIKGSYMVQPSEQKPDQVMYLTDCDQSKAVTHAPTVYFYRPSTKCFSDSLEILRDSLSKALNIFYPLAGRLHWVNGGRVELHCNNNGVLLVQAESSSSIADFGDFTPTPAIRNLIPTVDLATKFDEVPLLLVQLTKLSCGGMSLGLAMSHVIVDGQSALHFVGEWARIARGEQVKSLPFLDRTILRDYLEALPSSHGGGAIELGSEMSSIPLMIGKTDNIEERNKPAVAATLKLSANQVEMLKNKANKDPSWNKSVDARKFSRFEAISGHIWRCGSKANKHQNEQLTRSHVVVDFRNKIQPPLPKCYFGNGIIRSTVTITAGELFSNPLGFACFKIRQAVEKVTDEYVKSYLTQIKNLPDVSVFRNFHTVGCSKGPFYGNPNIEITSWAGLSIFDADFGWGKEFYMGPGILGYEGKVFIVPCHDEDGSFYVILRRQEEHMEAFKRHFYEDILLD